MHNLQSYSAYSIKVQYTYFSEIKQFYQIATLHSYTVRDGRTQLDTVTLSRTSLRTVEHGQTSSHRYFARKLPYMVKHGCTHSHIGLGVVNGPLKNEN